MSNNGTARTDYHASAKTRWKTQGTGAFRGGSTFSTAHADFDQFYDPVTSYHQGSSTGSYTVRAGDTLSGIAAGLWGDAALWYKLAEANGLSGQ